MSKNYQKLDIFKKKEKLSFFSKKLPLAISNVVEKNDNFWQFFDIQLAIFRRVSRKDMKQDIMQIPNKTSMIKFISLFITCL